MNQQSNNSTTVYEWLVSVLESVNHNSQLLSCELLIDNFKKNYQSSLAEAESLEKIKIRKQNEYAPEC